MRIPAESLEEIRKTLTTYMLNPVDVYLYTQTLNCPTCPDAESLAKQLEPLHPALFLHIINPLLDKNIPADVDLQYLPLWRFESQKTDPGIRFYGLPAGYEFAVFIETILTLSQNQPALEQPYVERIQRLQHTFHIKVFVTPTCPYCPQMAMLATQSAFIHPKIRSSIFEIEEFPQLAQQYNIRSVPLTIINDSLFIPGALPPDEFIRQLENHESLEEKVGPHDDNDKGTGLIIIP